MISKIRICILTAVAALAVSALPMFAQQGGSGGGGAAGIPGPTGASQCFISTASGLGNWTWGSCSGSSNLAFSALTTSTNTTAVMTIGSGATFNIASGAVIDFSSLGTGTFKLPAAAGAAASATKNFIYDSTNKNWHIWSNGVDELHVDHHPYRCCLRPDYRVCQPQLSDLLYGVNRGVHQSPADAG